MSTAAGKGISGEGDVRSWKREPIKPGKSDDQLQALAAERFGLARDAKDRWNLTMTLAAGQAKAKLHEVVRVLRDDPELRFDMLLDLAAIDYLSYPNHRGPRFAVVYLFKSLVFRHRFKLKVEVEEDDAELPSIHDLYRIADWSEREVFDQMGVVFSGHPNLKRILNHHEFIGHPLRKDYPCQKRQKLSINDPMVDQLESRLKHFGYQVVDSGEVHLGAPIAAKHQSVAEQGSVDTQKQKNAAGAVGAGGI
ncbi:MAG: NADH-quinone oxidoreductase subunit C [Planctomycetes bacterium]|nr:NADH-quinone oxidoreductase subunit C [Planctomycetota bacterium]